MLACDHENVKPDILTLGKALSGGVFPVSAALCNNEVMMVIKPGEHGSTYGGNPVASAVGMAALNVLIDEKLSENSEIMGNFLRNELERLKSKHIKIVRGRGLLNAIVIDENENINAWDLCVKMAEKGLLAKPTHGNIIRFAPPLIINQDEMSQCLDIIDKSLQEF